MCGLCGCLSSWLVNDDLERFQHLAMVATFRGSVGGGVAIAPTKPTHPIEVVKSEQSLAHLVLETPFYEAVKGTNGKKKVSAIMGHARYPTRGGLETNSIHPHQYHHITGMHNGTFTKVRNQAIGQDDIDSAKFFEHVADNGIDEAIRQCEGAYALTWFDNRTDTVYFLRNNQRPLYIGYYPTHRDVMYWHSEALMLKMILMRDANKPTDPDPIVKAIPVDRLVSFRIHNGASAIKPVSERSLGKAHVSVPLSPSGTADHTASTRSETTQADAIHGTTKSPGSNLPMSELAQEWDMLETKKSQYLTRKEVEHLVCVVGCSNCHMPSTMLDYKTKNMEWFKTREFMCQYCMSDPVCLQHMAASGHLPSSMALGERLQ